MPVFPIFAKSMSEISGSLQSLEFRNIRKNRNIFYFKDVGRSCILVTIAGKNVMFDCGMHMGYNDEV